MPAILSTLKYQFPLLGLWMDAHSGLSKTDPYARLAHTKKMIVEVLPPQISSLRVSQNYEPMTSASSFEIIDAVFGRETGYNRHILYTRDDNDEKPWTSMSESMYHVTNMTGWILMLLLAPKSWMSPWWIQLYLWNNVLGSAIALPFSIRKWLSSRSLIPKYHLLGSVIPGPAKMVLCLAIFGAMHAATNLPLCFASASNYGVLVQGSALAASLFVSQMRNAFVYGISKAY